MFIKQISIFLENKSGRLAEVTKALGEKNIDISALSIADTTDFGILRIIVNDPDTAEKILKDEGFAVSVSDVLAIGVADEPGGLSKALIALNENNIGIEYMYAFVSKTEDEALVILRVEDPERAVEVLKTRGIKVLTPSEVYNL